MRCRSIAIAASAVQTGKELTLASFPQRTCPSLSQHPASTNPSAAGASIMEPCMCHLADVPLAPARERGRRGQLHVLCDKTAISPGERQHMREGPAGPRPLAWQKPIQPHQIHHLVTLFQQIKFITSSPSSSRGRVQMPCNRAAHPVMDDVPGVRQQLVELSCEGSVGWVGRPVRVHLHLKVGHGPLDVEGCQHSQSPAQAVPCYEQPGLLAQLP